MKNIPFSILALLSSPGAQARITVTSATFPAAGDTLWYAQANNQALPGMFTPPGGDQNRDFSALTANVTFETICRPAGPCGPADWR